ncbi:MAG: tyrosine protein phosphatase [Notoacmeibacter sp.]|nr:tyrosine protein phosphatase [Notoacmeibacter sp.]
MPHIVVTSLACLHDTVAAHDASHVVTLINEGTPVKRPGSVPEEQHLFLAMHDIDMAMDGMTPPGEAHVRRLIEFVQQWDRARPLVVHCFAGISRSTAGAFIAASVLNPDLDEMALARHIRTKSTTATPNRLLIQTADRLLGRQGRMVRAIDAIGVGDMAFQGQTFILPLAPEKLEAS